MIKIVCTLCGEEIEDHAIPEHFASDHPDMIEHWASENGCTEVVTKDPRPEIILEYIEDGDYFYRCECKHLFSRQLHEKEAKCPECQTWHNDLPKSVPTKAQEVKE